MRHQFPAGWKSYKLNQLGFVGRGRSRHRPRNDPSLYGGNYPFFQTGDIKSANFYLTRYSQTYNECGLAQSKQWEPGTLCITIAANIAETAILGIHGCFPDSVIGFVTDPAQADARFIKYYIDLLKLDMQQVSHGTTQDNLSLDKLLRFDFVVPHVRQQRKIAAILSAYDDLIENNLRRIKILEEMAQALYREWFVKFRFPGHEHARFVDSPLGRIPEGWEIKRLADVCDLTMGQSPRSEYYNAEGIGLPFHQGVTDFGDRYPTERLYCTVEGRVAEKGDILFSVRAPVGRINIATTKIVIGRGLSAIRHRAGFQWFAYHLLKESFREEDSMGGGTIFKSVTRSDMEGISFLSPELPPLQQYERLVEPMEIQIEDLTRKNSNLRRTRDLLLPKLVSGEVDVLELDIAVPEAVGA